jgi:hypothetical protein
MISNYNRNLEYKQPLLVLRSRLQPMGSSRFNFNFPPPLDIPFVSKSLILGMTLHIATNPSVGRINRIIDFIKSLPGHLSLYGGFSHDDWIKLFAAPTFFIYVEKDGVILSAMSIVKMVSTQDDVILNIITTQANNQLAKKMVGKLLKGLGDIMFTEVRFCCI